MQNYAVSVAIVLAAIIIAFTFRYESVFTGKALIRIDRFTGDFEACSDGTIEGKSATVCRAFGPKHLTAKPSD